MKAYHYISRNDMKNIRKLAHFRTLTRSFLRLVHKVNYKRSITFNSVQMNRADPRKWYVCLCVSRVLINVDG